MSLRARISIMNIALMGGLLLLFGAVVYSLVTIFLIEQIDNTLEETVSDIRQVTRVNSVGQLDVITLPTLDLTANVYVQAWGRDGELKASSPNIGNFRRPLDQYGMGATEPIFRETMIGQASLRVLTVPLEIGARPVGMLQVATSLVVVQEAQRALIIVMSLAAVVAMSVAGLASWVSTSSVLAPLRQVIQHALEITRMNDLSRRIPVQEPLDEDIGQLIQAFNQTLSRLERLIATQRRFLTDVGHELRTPLTVIKGNVDLMRRMGCGDEESLVGIESEVSRLTRLVGDLLLLSQAESGKLPMERKVVELDTLLLEVFRQAKVLAQDRIQVQIGEIDQVLVCGDQDRIKQVFLNLIGNAIKYTPEHGRVVISLGKTAGQARFMVSDTGPGIPSEDLPHIFERFYRAEKSRLRTQDGKGFGLGLSIAYWIVRNHGGRIEVDSQPGVGTTFSVWMPLSGENCDEAA